MKRLLFFTVLCTGIAMFLAGPVCAGVTGVCVNCHTMHNSQDGLGMELYSGETGPFPSLTRGSCVGCHTGVVDGGVTPFVNSVAVPTDILAGGNFYWVCQTGGSPKGHNVMGLPGIIPDAILNEAPGNAYSCANSCHMSLAVEQTSLTEYGSGCEGCHLEPKHHAPHQGDDAVAMEANGYFRFLASHNPTGSGVEGIEDNDWHYTNSATDHNEYLGYVGTHTAGNGGFATLGNTMTAYCTGCHGNFHLQQDGDANWIRHPSDAVIPNSGEYSVYTTYNPIAPPARPDLSGYTGPTGTVAPGTDLVMCLSCHRAHGGPYDDLLRWDYGEMVAGGASGSPGTGCFVCHTLKDE